MKRTFIGEEKGEEEGEEEEDVERRRREDGRRGMRGREEKERTVVMNWEGEGRGEALEYLYLTATLYFDGSSAPLVAWPC